MVTSLDCSSPAPRCRCLSTSYHEDRGRHTHGHLRIGVVRAAKRTPRDKPRTLHIQVRFGKVFFCAAIGALSLCARDIQREYPAQFTGGSVTVKIVHRCTHVCSPVAPKRSVLILSRSWPTAIRRSVVCSTNDVGPQTYVLGPSFAGHVPHAINSPSMR